MKVRVFAYEHLSGGGCGDEAGGDDAALLAQGLAMRDAICADLSLLGSVAVTCATDCSLGAGPKLAGVEYLSPAPGLAAFDFVRQQSLVHDLAWIVAPECEGVLAALCDIVGPQRWIGCDSAAIRIASSKRRTLDLLSAHGLATPRSFEGDPGVARWVVKPDDGAGASATRLHADFEAAVGDAQSRYGEAVVEPWVEGEPMSLSLLCDGGRGEVLCINRQRIVVDGEGAVSYAGVDIDAVRRDDPRAAALRESGVRVAQALPGLRGYVGVDLVWHARRGPVVIEVNPRLTSAYVGLSAALDRSIADEILALFWKKESRRVDA